MYTSQGFHGPPRDRTFLTVWKLKDFSVIHILREITFFEEFESSKNAIFVALNSVVLVHSRLQKVQKFIKIKIQSLVKLQILHFYNPQIWFHVKS